MPVRALIVEDLPADAELISFELKGAGMEPVVRRVETAEDFVRELDEFKPDVILSDFSIPGFSGLSALELTLQRSPATPFIFVSGTIGEETAILTLKLGAADFILKGDLGRLSSRIHRALREGQERAARLLAEERVKHVEARFRLFMEHLPNAAFLKDLDGRYLFANEAAGEAFGAATHDIVGKSDAELMASDSATKARAMDLLAIWGGQSLQAVETLAGRKGDRQWLTTTFPLKQGDDVLIGGVAVDVTERLLVEEALRLSDRAIDASINPIVIVGSSGAHNPILFVNTAFEKVSGYSREEVVGRDCSFLQGEDRAQPELAEIRNAIREQREGHALLRNYRKDGTLFWNNLHITPVRDPTSGRTTHFVGVLQDITETKRYQEELAYQANHDALTTLPNRNLLKDRLEQAIIHARRHGGMLTVALLDLDHFKLVNDSLGHERGDALLKAIADRLMGCVRQGDTVARLGGDEFVIVVCDQEHEEGALQVIERIVAAVGRPLLIDGQELHVTCSVGLSTYPHHGEDAGALLRNADAAMYRVKAQSRNGVQFYATDMSAGIGDRLALVAGLRHALERDEFVLHYQPQIDLSTGRIFGVEALIRWRHPTLGTVLPASFIPVAEESGLIMPIGAWALQTACTQNKRWQEAGLPAIAVAVNLSPRQFRKKGIVDTVAGILQATKLDPCHLELDLTEGMMTHSVDGVIGTLNELRALGVSMTVDEFRIGYSSLKYLKRFPVDRLKIVGSFVRDIGMDSDETAFTHAVIALGHSLRLRVVAERVESAAQLAFLQDCDCDEAQGYLFSKPLAAEDVEPLLRGAAVF